MAPSPSTAKLAKAPGLVIDGEVVAGEADAYPVNNPVRPAEIVLEAPAASLDQVDRAVVSARRAQAQWGAMDPGQRADLVCKAATAVGTAVAEEDLGELLTREHGKVLWEAQFDTSTIAGMASAYAPLAVEALAGRTLESGGGRRTLVRHEPFGVVAAILPFNWPVSVMANKVLPALLTGNTVVVKAPPTCPGAVLFALAALASELPPGVVNAVNGPGPDVGRALVEHPGIDMVSFTGGVIAGRNVMATASDSVKPVVLELGGNDPAVIAPDVEIDEELASKLADAAFITSGQVCMAVKRVYAPSDRVPQLIDALVERVRSEVVGDGLAEGVTMGPVHRAEARNRVEEMLAQAETSGAKVHRPAKVRPEDASNDGYLVSPAIVESPSREARIVRQEQFAPALPVLAYTDLEDALAQANDTSFGLCASVWTGDDDVAAAFSKRLQAGTVFVNCHGTSAMDYRAPMGGWKESGYGLELGPEGMLALTHSKTVLEQPAGA